MKHSITKLKTILATATLLYALNSSAQNIPGPASSGDTGILAQILNSINYLTTMVSSTIGATVAAHAREIYETDPALPHTIVANTTQTNAGITANQNTQTYALNAVQQELIQANDIITPLSNIMGSDTYQQPSLASSIFGGFINNNNNNPSAGNVNFNFSTLVAPDVYSPITQQQANNFIYFAANLSSPLTTINWNTLSADQKMKLQTNPVGRDYRVALRSVVAARSVGIDNLYHLMAERIPIANLGNQLGMPTKDASPLQVKEYLATRRATSQEWYNDMAKASPATIQRETLFVLAEMQKQFYDLHRDNERMLATLSLIELQNSQFSQMNLQERETAVKALLGIKDNSNSASRLSEEFGISGADVESLKQEIKDEAKDIDVSKIPK